MTERDPLMTVLAALVAAVSLLERGGKQAAPSDAMFDQMLIDYRNAIEVGRQAARAAAPASNSCNPKLQSNPAELLPEQALREAHERLEGAYGSIREHMEALREAHAEITSSDDALRVWRGRTERAEAEVERLRALLRDVRRRSFDGLMNDRIDAELKP